MKLSIRTKLIGVFTLFIIVMAILGWRGVVGMHDINANLNTIYINQFVPSQIIGNANIALIAWNRATLNHVLAEDKQKMDEYEIIIFEQKNAVVEKLQTLSEMESLSKTGKNLVRKIYEQFQQAFPIQKYVVELSRVGQQEKARQLLRAKLKTIIDEIDVDMTEFFLMQERRLNEVKKAIDERYDQGLRGISLIIVSALIVAFLIAFYISNSISKGVNEMVRGAKLVAVGDLKQARLAITSKDEFGYLGVIFNRMLDSLEESLVQRKRAEEALKEYSERLEETVEQRTKELRDAQEQLIRQEQLAILGQLAGGVGHDLRNPLGAIKGGVYFLNMALEEPEPKIKETLEILENEVGTSERIISSLLGFARPRPPTRKKVNINDVVQEALSHSTVPENIELVSQLNESLPSILADPDQIGQAFENIILNAIQAMPEGGRLTVKTSVNSDFGELSRGVGPPETTSSGCVAASFTDTGVGIPEENLRNLFEPLFTTKAKGIGLGLALTKIQVEGHGGSIEVQSRVGKGSTFTVRLPVGSKSEIRNTKL